MRTIDVISLASRGLQPSQHLNQFQHVAESRWIIQPLRWPQPVRQAQPPTPVGVQLRVIQQQQPRCTTRALAAAQPWPPTTPRCQQCSPQAELSKSDMQSGLVALLDRFVADETRSDADRDILHHASELRRLLAHKENPRSATLRHELEEKRPGTTPRPVIPPTSTARFKKPKTSHHSHP